jgi:hypothetical protein
VARFGGPIFDLTDFSMGGLGLTTMVIARPIARTFRTHFLWRQLKGPGGGADHPGPPRLLRYILPRMVNMLSRGHAAMAF